MEYVWYALGILFFIYVAGRLVSAAFYQSKKDYERSTSDGTSTQPKQSGL